jgi:hypothetical protein
MSIEVAMHRDIADNEIAWLFDSVSPGRGKSVRATVRAGTAPAKRTRPDQNTPTAQNFKRFHRPLHVEGIKYIIPHIYAW